MVYFRRDSKPLESSRAFTLIEVVISIGLMGIAFLATSGAITTLMIRQDINYNNIVAASASSLLFSPDRTGNTPTLSQLVGADAFLKPLSLKMEWCTFRNGPDLADAYNQSAPGRWQAFQFNDASAFGGAFDLRAYRSLVVTIHSPETMTADQQVWPNWYYDGTRDLTLDLKKVFPHYRFGEDLGGTTTTPLYFSQVTFWHASRPEAIEIAAAHAAGTKLPVKLDFLGSYRYLHPVMAPWAPLP